MPDVSPASVIVVTYNSAATVSLCLKSIPDDCQVVVVDQDSHDDTIAIARRARPDATVISAGSNRGFGAGCNLGAANATSDVLIFLNPDARFADGAVRALVRRVDAENTLVGPRILDSKGTDQTRARFWSTPLSVLAEVWLPTALTRFVLRRDIPPEYAVYRYGGRVPYIQGTCMAVSAESFWRAGGFDERLFLYHEEEVLARRLLGNGVSAALEPSASIIHIGAHSTSQVRDFAAGQYYRSAALAVMTHYPRRVAIPTAVALSAILIAMAILTPVRAAVGWRAEKGFSWYRSGAVGALAGIFGRVVQPPRHEVAPPVAHARSRPRLAG